MKSWIETFDPMVQLFRNKDNLSLVLRAILVGLGRHLASTAFNFTSSLI